jgi:hypothetical protein
MAGLYGFSQEADVNCFNAIKGDSPVAKEYRQFGVCRSIGECLGTEMTVATISAISDLTLRSRTTLMPP